MSDLRALLEAATPGHWFAEIEDETALLQAETAAGFVYLADSDGIFGDADAALIVAAVNSLPRLLDKMERAEAALREISESAWARRYPRLGRLARAALSALDEQGPPPCKECGGPTVFYDDTPSRRLFKCEACSTPENYRWTTVPREEREPR